MQRVKRIIGLTLGLCALWAVVGLGVVRYLEWRDELRAQRSPRAMHARTMRSLAARGLFDAAPIGPISLDVVSVRARLRDELRGPLDARLAGSVAALDSLLGVRGEAVELPKHVDPVVLLDRLARRAGRVDDEASRPTVAHVTQLPAADAAALLQRIAREAPEGAPLRVRAPDLARALTVLWFETRDTEHAADPLASNAFAALALARAQGQGARDAEALLLHAMGYVRAARALSRELPASDPVRAYVHGEAPVGDAPGVRYLALRLALAKGDLATAARWVSAASDEARERAGVAAFVAGRLQPTDLAARSRELDALLPAVARGLAREHGIDLREGASVWQSVDTLAAAGGNSPDLAARMLRARVATHTLSALSSQVAFLQDVRGERATHAWLSSLETRAEFVAPWREVTRLQLRLDAGDEVSVELLRMAHEATLPAAARLRAWSDFVPRVAPFGDPVRLGMARVARTVDTRPGFHRLLLDALVSEGMDLGTAETMCAELEPSASSGWLDAWCAGLARSADETPAETERRLREAIRGDAWRPRRDALASWLIAQGRSDDARAEAESFLREHAQVSALERAHVQTALSRAALAGGDVATAASALTAAVETGFEGALRQRVDVHLAAGELDDALALARLTAERYPGPRASGALAEALWRKGSYRDAADAVSAVRGDPEGDEWREHIAARFVRCFARLPAEQSAAAATELVARRAAPEAVLALSRALVATHGAHALAVSEVVPFVGPTGMRVLLDRYSLRAQVQGEQAALDWIMAQTPPPHRAALAQGAFARGVDAVVWTVYTPTPGEPQWDYFQLLRAAGTLRTPALGAHRDEVLAAVATPRDRNGHYARYLLGAAPASSIVSQAHDESARAEVAFWLGFRAVSEGRRADAATWYALAARHGPGADLETRLAHEALSSWLRRGRGVAPAVPAASSDDVPVAAPAQGAGATSDRLVDTPRRRHRRHRRHHHDA